MSVGHNHSLTSSKICCPQHIFEITKVLKQQNRLNERGTLLKRYLDTHTTPQIMMALKDNSVAKHKLLKLYNDEICKLIISGKYQYRQLRRGLWRGDFDARKNQTNSQNGPNDQSWLEKRLVQQLRCVLRKVTSRHSIILGLRNTI